METWVIYAILAALSWGTYIVINKMAGDINPYIAAVAMGVGVFAFFGIIYLALRPEFNNNWQGLGLSVVAGIIWALGMLFALLALANNAPVAKLAPIYNINTLIAVALGMVVLKELPVGEDRIKVIIGAILIVIGGILVSS